MTLKNTEISNSKTNETGTAIGASYDGITVELPDKKITWWENADVTFPDEDVYLARSPGRGLEKQTSRDFRHLTKVYGAEMWKALKCSPETTDCAGIKEEFDNYSDGILLLALNNDDEIIYWDFNRNVIYMCPVSDQRIAIDIEGTRGQAWANRVKRWEAWQYSRAGRYIELVATP